MTRDDDYLALQDRADALSMRAQKAEERVRELEFEAQRARLTDRIVSEHRSNPPTVLYTDDELRAWIDRLERTWFGDLRVVPSLRRVMRELDEVRRERGEARGVARDLAVALLAFDGRKDREEVALCKTALLYPDTRPNDRASSVPDSADPTDKVDT